MFQLFSYPGGITAFSRDEAILYGDTWLTLPDWTHQTGQDRHSVTETTAALIGFLFHVSGYPAALQRSTI